MDDRQLIEDLLSALEYHTEQTRPIEFSKVAIEAAREYLQKPAQRPWQGLTDEEMNAALDYWSEDERSAYGGAHAADGEYVSMIDTWRYIEAKLREKNT